MHFNRLFTKPGRPIADQISWKKVPAEIKGSGFHMAEIEVPSHWSETASNILAQKYFRKAGVPSKTLIPADYTLPIVPQWLRVSIPDSVATFGSETSARQVFHRLAGHWTYVGWKHDYFKDDESSARTFYDELYFMLAMQMAAPNSPQWFNTGLWWAYGIAGPDSGQWAVDYGKSAADHSIVFQPGNSYEYPQAHACFIQPVSDDLVSPGGIMDLALREVRLFKQGSGTGTNFSAIRGKGEKLSGGGVSSGLMSFLEILDRSAGAIQSGGTTRRAAKLVCLDLDHPEIEDFIQWKVREERKALALYEGSRLLAARDGGPEYSIAWEGEAIRTVSGQNSNNSIRITDEFLAAVDTDGDWNLTARTDGRVVKTLKARALWNAICEAAWQSADPGLQFHDSINAWHTCKADGQINASNPCCFVGSTLVDTSEGLVSLEYLANMDHNGQELPYVFGFDRNSALPALRKVKRAWSAGYTRNLVKVRLDTGEEFTCTPEHNWLLRNGEYVQAQNLTKGMSLRKVGRTVNYERGSRCSILHRCTDEIPNGTQYQNRWMWEQLHGPIPKGFDVHHKDGNSTNDRLSNLELISSTDHKINHSTGSNNPRYMVMGNKALVEIYDAILALPRRTHKNIKGVSPGRWNTYIRENNLVGIIPQAQSPSKGGRIQGLYWYEFVEKMERLRAEVNAKIVSVIKIKTEQDVAVFDIEVEGIHNFGIRGNTELNQSSIVVSNSEYMFLDSTACNLASLNLVNFLNPDHTFNIPAFKHATRLWTVVLDISVSMASFPSREIAEGSYKYRTLGLGYANAGGLLMHQGLPYDSPAGRDLIASITALMHGMAYCTSADLAEQLGPFPRHSANATAMHEVIYKHNTTRWNYDCSGDIIYEAKRLLGFATLKPSFRNAQVTLLAPTGTISLVMDCGDFTGIEPAFALRTHKHLAGGGSLSITVPAVSAALEYLGYPAHIRQLIEQYIAANGTVEGCPDIKPEHIPVFDCANPAPGHTRYIRPMAHVEMVAAVQPFLSGAVSKTINLPNTATVEDVSEVYRKAHSLGLKAVALYRDGSKLSQPLSAVDSSPSIVSTQEIANEMVEEEIRGVETNRILRSGREALLPRRKGYTQKFRVDGQSIYLRTGEYEDGRLGELFVTMSKEGSTARAFMEAFAKAASIALQYGVPLKVLVSAFTHIKFEPAGPVQGHERIKTCSSPLDLIFRDLGLEYLGMDELAQLPPPAEAMASSVIKDVTTVVEAMTIPSGQICSECGSEMRRSGTCLICPGCGNNTGCG